MNELVTTSTTAITIAATFDTSILAGTKSPNTIEQYRLHFGAYCQFAGSWVNAMQPATLARWRQSLFESDKGYAVASINQRLASVRGVVAEAAQQGYVAYDTAQQFRAVRGLTVKANKGRVKQHARTAISKQDMQRLIDAPNGATLAGQMHRALLLTLATCGMRISEAVALRVSDITFGTDDDGNSGWSVMVLGKNMDKPEPRALGKAAKLAIDAWLAVRPVQSEYIFTGFAGRGDRATDQPITRQAAWQMVTRYAAQVGLEHVKPHDLRRFVGTSLAKRDIRLAQKQLGHKRLETTAQHYVLDSVRLGVTDDLL